MCAQLVDTLLTGWWWGNRGLTIINLMILRSGVCVPMVSITVNPFCLVGALEPAK